MKSKAFAIRDQVWIRLETTPDGSKRPRELYFDSIEVAEEMARAIMAACEQARRYQPEGLVTDGV